MPNPKKSQAAKNLDGNPGKRSMVPAGPKAAPGRPAIPELPEAAREEWDRVTALLDAENRLTEHDGGMLKRHGLLYSRLEECHALINEHGLMTDGQRGLVKNPAVQLERGYFQLYQKSCELLGVDPRRRDAAQVEVDDDTEGLLD